MKKIILTLVLIVLLAGCSKTMPQSAVSSSESLIVSASQSNAKSEVQSEASSESIASSEVIPEYDWREENKKLLPPPQPNILSESGNLPQEYLDYFSEPHEVKCYRGYGMINYRWTAYSADKSLHVEPVDKPNERRTVAVNVSLDYFIGLEIVYFVADDTNLYVCDVNGENIRFLYEGEQALKGVVGVKELVFFESGGVIYRLHTSTRIAEKMCENPEDRGFVVYNSESVIWKTSNSHEIAENAQPIIYNHIYNKRTNESSDILPQDSEEYFKLWFHPDAVQPDGFNSGVS